MGADRDTVDRILAEAHAAIEAASIPDDVRPVAFGKAFDMLAGAAASTAATPETDDTGLGTGTRLGRIAKKLNIDVKTAEYFFDPDEEDVTLAVPRSKLDSNKSTATRQVALLYCAARQAGGYDDTHTSVANVRSKVENMGVLDPGNFATHLKNIEGITVRGSGQSREFKVTSHGYEQAAKLMNQIKGGAS
jgi:hypothetical protein